MPTQEWFSCIIWTAVLALGMCAGYRIHNWIEFWIFLALGVSFIPSRLWIYRKWRKDSDNARPE